MPTSEHRANTLFSAAYGSDPEGRARAPGRVNLIGDHTDYNGGFVLPMAIDRDTNVAFRSRPDSRVRIVSEHGESATFDLDDITHGEPSWSEYVRGVAWALGIVDGRGWDGAVASDVPLGAGLSSSASLELAVAEVLARDERPPPDPITLALAGQRAENEWVGMECGIMDQLTIAASVGGSALLIDCQDLSFEPIPVPDGVVFVVLDTATRRSLTSSAYNVRRRTCEEAAAELGVASLREIEVQDLDAAADALGEEAHRRVRHVVTENDRVLQAAEALRSGDVERLGTLMNESHESLRADFESSTRPLDSIVGIANSLPGCFGARVTGAGFGGCAVAAVDEVSEESFSTALVEEYDKRSGIRAQTFVCRPATGSSLIVDDRGTAWSLRGE